MMGSYFASIRDIKSMSKVELREYLEGVRGFACHDDSIKEMRETAIDDTKEEIKGLKRSKNAN